MVNSNMSIFAGCRPPRCRVCPISAHCRRWGENKLPAVAQAVPATGNGLVEGDFKTAGIVQRPNTVSKWIFYSQVTQILPQHVLPLRTWKAHFKEINEYFYKSLNLF